MRLVSGLSRVSWRRRLPLVVVLVVTVGMVTALAAPNTTTFAFVARGDNPIDALAAAPIAGRLNAPVLLTPSTTLADPARDGLSAADPDVVIIAGGTAAVSDAVMTQIQQLLPDADVRRVSGANRYVTAGELAALIRTIEPAFAMTEGADTNAYGITCPSGQMLTGITDSGQPDCAVDSIDGGDAATLTGTTADQLANDLDVYCQLATEHPASYPPGPCSDAPAISTLDADGNVGWDDTSTAIGSDGMPIIAYRDNTNTDLKVVHCTTASCSSTDTPQALDTTGNVGAFTSIAIGTDGMPIIAYRDDTNEDLKVVQVR